MPSKGHNWKFSQCFGDKGDIENITEADLISTVEFDHTGDYLATGDKGGRVVLFERNENKAGCEYRFHTEFQSHDAEFDYLKSLEIEEKINKIKWCKRQNQAHFLLSTNDKTIKLWKIYEKSLKIVAENNLSDNNNGSAVLGPANTNVDRKFTSMASLKLPRMTLHDTIIAAAPRRIYSNAHAYHINSISVNSDGETFISADDLRINLWNMAIADQSFNIVDIKPANMEELTEVITCAEFHPSSCNLFMYSSSKGTIKLADMRENALCDSHAKMFEEWMDPAQHSFFTEITSSISDVKFSNDGRYIVSRDYLTVKIWDVNMEREPVKTINVHDHLRDRLCDPYENDAIFDKFEVVFSGDGRSVMTGSYNNNFMIYPNVVGGEDGKKKQKQKQKQKKLRTVSTNDDEDDDDEDVEEEEDEEEEEEEEEENDESEDSEIILQADKSAFKTKRMNTPSVINRRKKGIIGGMRKDIDTENIDYKKSILHLSWHPHENSVAIAATNNLFIFSAL